MSFDSWLPFVSLFFVILSRDTIVTLTHFRTAPRLRPHPFALNMEQRRWATTILTTTLVPQEAMIHTPLPVPIPVNGLPRRCKCRLCEKGDSRPDHRPDVSPHHLKEYIPPFPLFYFVALWRKKLVKGMTKQVPYSFLTSHFTKCHNLLWPASWALLVWFLTWRY